MFAQERDRDEGPLVRIGELSRRTGVNADTLRAWERRYGLLSPARSDGGFRLYSRGDEERVQAMRALIDSGVSASEAARLARSGMAPKPSAIDIPSGGADRRLREALERYDEAEANSVLDDAIAALSVEALAKRVVLPVLEEVGERWERGEASVGQEHFATNIVRGRLAGLARNWGAGSGPLAILACPSGELHDIGLILFGLVLRARGWRIAYLGANTPIETVEDAVERLGSRAVVLAALSAEPFDSAAEEIARLAGRTRVLLAGRGAGEGLAERAGAELLSGDPVGAADELAAAGAGS
jgi:MerR family transcriptional regulator, light-induced transcriptional regulator